MSPSLPASARAAGQRLTDEARNAKPSKWRCLESGCGAEGIEQTRKGRERALYHHMQAHNEVDF